MESFDIMQYCDLFKVYDKAPHRRECQKRMEWFLKQNPQFTFNDILMGTKIYIQSMSYNNGKYVREPHYFIKKGVGVNEISDLYTWVERWKHSQMSVGGRSQLQNTMQ